MRWKIKQVSKRVWPAASLVLVLAGGGAGSTRARAETVPVSPGLPDTSISGRSSCPSFAWGNGKESPIELAIWRLPDGAEKGVDSVTQSPPWLARSFPAGARVWVPELAGCLPSGAGYAWSVRPAGDTRWAPPLYFGVPSEVSADEVREALEALGLWREPGTPELGDAPELGAPATARSESTAQQRSKEAAPGLPVTGTPSPRLPAVADTTALVADVAAAAGISYGIYGATDSSGTGSAGLIGQSTATTGITYGVLGLVASPDGVAGVFENVGGGDAIRGLSAGVEVFSVAADGVVTAVDFEGDGSQLFDAVSGLACTRACVDSSEILDGSIVESRLQSNSVGSFAIADGVVNALHIADGSVGSSELATNSVGEDEIATGAVGAAEIQANAVGAGEILSLQVETADLANDAVTRSKIKGTEVKLYETDDDCSDAGDLTLSAICLSVQGSCPVGQFQNCSGGCGAVPLFCNNSFEGYLLDPTLLN